MPDFNKLCVATWRANNPDWKVIILSDDNFKKYVAADEIPSTFYSLKVQHRSDLVRIAVLLRYGGVYMDITTVCCKGFDDIFDNPETPELLLATGLTLSTGEPLPNNCLFLARTKNNPFLTTFLEQMKAYWERPAYTLDEMRQRKEFSGIMDAMLDANVGILAGTELYCANLLLLGNLLRNDPTTKDYVNKNVRYLSHWSWSLPDFRPDPTNGVKDVRNVDNRKFWSVMKLVNAMATATLTDDADLAHAFYNRVCVMKVSSDANPDHDCSFEEIVAQQTTYGRVLRMALDKNQIDQAKVEGMRTILGSFV